MPANITESSLVLYDQDSFGLIIILLQLLVYIYFFDYINRIMCSIWIQSWDTTQHPWHSCYSLPMELDGDIGITLSLCSPITLFCTFTNNWLSSNSVNSLWDHPGMTSVWSCFAELCGFLASDGSNSFSISTDKWLIRFSSNLVGELIMRLLSMWGKITILMCRLLLHGLYGLHGPRCPLSPNRPINLISLSYHGIPQAR